MTWYAYDDYGWYTGVLTGSDTVRATELAPQSLSTSTEIGNLRSNFFGTHWEVIPFTVPESPPENLEIPKQAKHIELYNAMKDAEAASILYEGNWYPTDKDAKDTLVGIMALGRVPDNLFWWTVDKTPIPVASMDFIKGLSGAVADRSVNYYNKLLQLSLAVNAAETHEQIESIVWEYP